LRDVGVMGGLIRQQKGKQEKEQKKAEKRGRSEGELGKGELLKPRKEFREYQGEGEGGGPNVRVFKEGRGECTRLTGLGEGDKGTGRVRKMVDGKGTRWTSKWES